jgi:hypothetical protein
VVAEKHGEHGGGREGGGPALLCHNKQHFLGAPRMFTLGPFSPDRGSSSYIKNTPGMPAIMILGFDMLNAVTPEA